MTDPAVNNGTPEQKPESKPDEALAAQLKEAREKADKLEAAEKKRKDADTAAKKKSDEDEAKKRGEHESIIEKQKAELKAANERLEAIEAATKKRIDGMIEKLPDAAKAKIAKIKDALPLDKLEDFVSDEIASASEASGNAPPNATPGGQTMKDGKRKLSPEAYEKLKMLGVSPELGEMSIKTTDTATGAVKIEFPINSMIERLKSGAPRPERLDSDTYRKKYGK